MIGWSQNGTCGHFELDLLKDKFENETLINSVDDTHHRELPL
jgi:hypothetical protein